ncbi:protein CENTRORADIALIS-like [Andrographis paniculata]|uniref:protein CENTRORADIALIS-like n=1 Tax=Andrographis paniculata TaxID=175694 RepID=UPI0021E7DB5B|nr:protein CENTRORADIALIS-like [Andrographis paniculata]
MSSSSDPLVSGRVIGEVVDNFNTTVNMEVVYKSKSKKQWYNSKQQCVSYVPVVVRNDHEIFPFTLTSKPRVQVLAAHFTTFFTLIMTDPDVPGPSDPYLREHLHWVITDIPGTTDSSFGREVVSYEMPRPKIGIHRYIFLLYKQKNRLQVSLSLPISRDGFCTRKFAEDYELGLPVAAVFFNCQRKIAPRRR